MKNLAVNEELNLEQRLDYLESIIANSETTMHKKLDEFELQNGRLKTKMTHYANIINALDENKTKELLKAFHNELSEMHVLVRNLISKLCTVSQVAWATKKTHKSKHDEILNSLFNAMDHSDEFWRSVDNKTIGEITDILLREE